MKNIKIGFIGLGQRGYSLLKDVVLPMNRAKITAVCDLYEDRVDAAAEAVVSSGNAAPEKYTDYNELLNDENVNTVVIAAAWEVHTEIAVKAMKAGKAVAMEVGGAYTVKECWELVETYESAEVPFMFLENCCFGRREMMALNMVKKGLFGTVVHCSGGYQHDLRTEISSGRENRHYRLRNYLSRNCENYPTHDLGPIARILNINHGNRMLTLSSTASKAAGLHEYILKNRPDDDFLKNSVFSQGDIITTVIKCAGGETVVLTLDTTLPRYYSRGFTVRGTAGMYEECTDSVFLDRAEDIKHDMDWRKSCNGNAESYAEEYEHPVWREYIKSGVQGTHDGMDWLEFKTFFDCLENDEPMPVDVYDAASWMAVTALSEQSVAHGGEVMHIPDFTKGKWALSLAGETTENQSGFSF